MAGLKLFTGTSTLSYKSCKWVSWVSVKCVFGYFWIINIYFSTEKVEKEYTDTMSPKIIIAGAPASGKGTQCEFIKEKYGVVHLSTGDMLRAAAEAGTDIGKKAQEFMNAGKLVTDEIIIGVVKERLAMDDCAKQGWLLDGFPRTRAQAEALAEAGIVADSFIFLDVPDEILVERVVGRRTDPETGKIYHMTFSPPEDEEVAARLTQRGDDTAEKVKVRLEAFHENVSSIIDCYVEILVKVNGNGDKNIIFSLIEKFIDAQVAFGAGAFGEALVFFDKAAEEAAKDGSKDALCASLIGRGRTECALGNIVHASHHIMEAKGERAERDELRHEQRLTLAQSSTRVVLAGTVLWLSSRKRPRKRWRRNETRRWPKRTLLSGRRQGRSG